MGVNEADRWRGRLRCYPGRSVWNAVEDSNRSREASLNIQKSANVIVPQSRGTCSGKDGTFKKNDSLRVHSMQRSRQSERTCSKEEAVNSVGDFERVEHRGAQIERGIHEEGIANVDGTITVTRKSHKSIEAGRTKQREPWSG